MKATKAYRDGGGTLQAGSAVQESQYDGLGRRIIKTVENSPPLDCAYHYYYMDGQRVIEERDGSDELIRQYVWGQEYIDELVQIGLNDDPTDASDEDGGTGGTQQVCESFYWACCDANYNDMGLVDSSGVLIERYEYTPYGERTVFFSPGTNDPWCYAPTQMSRRWKTAGGGTDVSGRPWGLCEVGHQGLFHDEETDTIHNRGRTLHPRLGGFLQRDMLEYIDGSNLYQYCKGNPVILHDELGSVSGKLHHPYPLHLGGRPDLVIELTEEQHNLAHEYFAAHGFPYGNEGRAAWQALTPRQQQAFVMRSLRYAGVKNSIIADNIDEIMANANPGTLTGRSGSISKVIKIGNVIAASLIVLTTANSAFAAEIPSDWRGNESVKASYWGSRACKCECADYLYTVLIPSWWTTGQSTEEVEVGPDSKWLDYGNLTTTECHGLEGGDEIVEEDWQIGFSIYLVRRTVCRFNGVIYGIPFKQ